MWIVFMTKNKKWPPFDIFCPYQLFENRYTKFVVDGNVMPLRGKANLNILLYTACTTGWPRKKNLV